MPWLAWVAVTGCWVPWKGVKREKGKMCEITMAPSEHAGAFKPPGPIYLDTTKVAYISNNRFAIKCRLDQVIP